MDKVIDFSKTVYELCKKDKEIISIMKEVGFDQITDPVSLNTVGRFMTIPKGAVLRKMDINKIKKQFEKKGYTIKKE